VERSAALALYEKVVAAMPGVERKGDTMPYTSLNGHMFTQQAIASDRTGDFTCWHSIDPGGASK
jgi:hypothetical protein